MTNLNLDPTKTAILSMDMQKAPVRRSAMFSERNVGQAAKSVLEAARKAGILVIHVVIDYQPAFFSRKEQIFAEDQNPDFVGPRRGCGRAFRNCR